MITMSHVLKFFAVLFIILGVVWFSFIQVRCHEIAPRPIVMQALKDSGGITEPAVKKVRSKHAKPYHDILFWSIAVIEVFVAVFYILAGIFLFKRFILSRFIVFFALGLHLLLQVLVIGFMKWATIPLSQLTRNPELLQLYFLPSQGIHNMFSVFVTGYRFFMPGGPIYMAGVIVYFVLCFYFFCRLDLNGRDQNIKQG